MNLFLFSNNKATGGLEAWSWFRICRDDKGTPSSSGQRHYGTYVRAHANEQCHDGPFTVPPVLRRYALYIL